MHTQQTARMYADFQGLQKLKNEAASQSDAAIEQVARQFESLFTQMMLKSMREASPGEGLFENSGTQMFRDMFDKQISLEMGGGAGGGLGLADTIARQMREMRQMTPGARGEESAGGEPRTFGLDSVPRTRENPYAGESAAKAHPGWDSPEAFVEDLAPHARRAADELGVEPGVLLAQAALETGWGEHVIRDGEGRSSFNLFNIKADPSWDGPRVSKRTLEFEQGVMQPRNEPFRAYDSPAEAFDDYVDFIRGNPRYRHALERASDSRAYVQELARAGYATDPDYAGKVLSVMRSGSLAGDLGSESG